MKAITITIWLVFSFMIIEGMILPMLNTANTIENYVGIIILVSLVVVSFKLKSGVSIYNYFNNLKTKEK